MSMHAPRRPPIEDPRLATARKAGLSSDVDHCPAGLTPAAREIMPSERPLRAGFASSELPGTGATGRGTPRPVLCGSPSSTGLGVPRPVAPSTCEVVNRRLNGFLASLSILICLAFPLPSRAADEPVSPAVDTSIAHGLAFLARQQQPDGAFTAADEG